MYQYITALAISENTDGRYQNVDVGQLPMKQLFTQYLTVFIYLKRLSDNSTVAIDVYKLPYSVRVSTNTVTMWLAANGNAALPIEPKLPDISYKQARFVGLWNTGLKVKSGNGTYHPDSVLADDQKVDAWLYAPNYTIANYRKMVENCLFTLNGFVLRSDYTPNGVCLYDANRNRRINDDTQLGAIDFSELGGVEIVDVDRSMITRNDTKHLEKGIYLKLPKTTVGHTPFLVLAGYLLPMNRCYRMVSDDVLKIELNYFNWAERFIEANEWVDLSGLDVEMVGDDSYSKTSLYSDEVFRRLIDHRQTFVVLVKALDVRVGKTLLQPTRLPNCFESTVVPTEPLMLGDGRMAEYTLMKQHPSKVAVYIRPSLRDTDALALTDAADISVVTRRRRSDKPYEFEDAYLLNIIKTEIK